jgi:hypothetical protein
MNIIQISFIISVLAVMPSISNAGFVSYPGQYKVKNNKCYEQILEHKKLENNSKWEEFDCVSRLEIVNKASEISNLVVTYRNLNQQGLVSEKAYLEILKSAAESFANVNSPYYKDREVLDQFLNDISSAQKKYPTKNNN